MTTPSQPSPTNLSDELKYILSCVYYAGVQSTLKGETIRTPTMSREYAKAAITTAYAEAGYVYHAQSDDFKVTTLRMGLMTGPEWYERFSDNLQELRDMSGGMRPYYREIDEAAKRASGLLPTNGSSAEKPTYNVAGNSEMLGEV